MSARWQRAAVWATLTVLFACRRVPPSEAPPDAQFPPVVRQSFQRLYPVFLQRKIERGRKAALWYHRYRGRWVRWTGQLVSFSENGITIKHLQSTVTFDVSLKVDPAQRERLRQSLRPGDFVTYTGRLETYDDTFRTLYLTSGTVSETPADGGTLAPAPVAGSEPIELEPEADESETPSPEAP
jgi:hypothetical protein